MTEPSAATVWSWVAGLFGAAFALAYLLLGCAPAVPPSIAAESAYTGALLRCVDEAASATEAKACRARVDAEWGVVSIGRRRDAGSD